MVATAFLDACGFIPASNGTGNFVVSAAIQGYRTPAVANAVDGAVYSYRAESADKSQWEDGSGAYTSSDTTLARTTIIANSSGGTSAINFSAAPNVFITATSADLQNASLLNNGTLPLAQRGYSMPDVIVEEQQPAGTNGGTATSGSFFNRALNFLVRNAGSIASLSSNQLTLPAGTYYFEWSAPTYLTAQHQTRLQNITDGITIASGTSEYNIPNSANDSCVTRSSGSTVETITTSKTFALQHRVNTSRSTNGLGLASNFGITEVYSRLKITKLA